MDIPKPAKQTPEEEARLRALEARVAEIERKEPEGRLVDRDPIDSVQMKEKDRQELRRRRHARDEEHREWVEAEIGKLEQMNLSPKEREERLLDVGLWRPKLPPDEEFFEKRLLELGRENRDLEELVPAVLAELQLAFDIPLGRYMRGWAAYFLASKDKSVDREASRAAAEKALKRHLLKEMGMTAADADEYVAECQNVTHSAIRQRRRRMRRKGDLR